VYCYLPLFKADSLVEVYHRNVQKVEMYKKIHILHLEIQTKRNIFQKYKMEISLHIYMLYTLGHAQILAFKAAK
jgi:hypothetical protein